ncbi:hypothetical protein J6A32_04145 [Methanocorpusculum sp.]|nr:hypothetical protein [Methanocorpusculum sp.]
MTQKQEEGRRTTTKSERTSASSFTNATPKHKKIIDAEEQQKSDEERLEVVCRMRTTKGIPHLLDETCMRNELLMIVETAAKTIRNILIRAADKAEYDLGYFADEMLEIRLYFHEPFHGRAVIKEEDEDGEN